MPANATNTRPTTQPRPTSATRSDRSSDRARIREGWSKFRNGSASYARHTAERSVDVPVGAALTVADRVVDLVEPFTARQTANQELRSIRTRVEREMNRLERRGATARRKTRTRVRRTRSRVERELNRRRRNVQATVRQNRSRAEGGLKRAQSAVQERVTALG